MIGANDAEGAMFLKVIACEIAARELYFTAAKSTNLIDLEFLTQGHHDTPRAGQLEIQKYIDAVPEGKYDAIVLGYGLCSSILEGVTARHTKLVVPRAHDCITFFLGSKERYQKCFSERPGTYYFTSGWLECIKRRGNKGPIWGGVSLPAGMALNLNGAYEEWVKKYGEDQAKYLLKEMGRWMEAYSHGTLIQFDFLTDLNLKQQVQQICREKSWQYGELNGDLSLFEKLLAGNWADSEFLLVHPGQKVAASFGEDIIKAV